MNRFRFLVFLPLFMLIGCAHRQPTTTFELIDTSLSISPRAQQAALNVVRGQIQRMRREIASSLYPLLEMPKTTPGAHPSAWSADQPRRLRCRPPQVWR